MTSREPANVTPLIKPEKKTLLKPIRHEVEALAWIWVALPSVSSQIPPPPPPVDPETLSEEERKEYEEKLKNTPPPPTVIDQQGMFNKTMERALECKDFRASCTEIVDTLLPLIHRACFPNSDDADNNVVAKRVAEAEKAILQDQDTISLQEFAEILFRHAVAPAGWLPPVDFIAFSKEEEVDPKDDGARSIAMSRADGAGADRERSRSRVGRHMSNATPRGPSNADCKTPLVKQFRELAQCILDNPGLSTEPQLVPSLDRVLTISGAGSAVPVKFMNYVDLDAIREYPKIYDDMWEAISSTTSTSPSLEEGFQNWFCLFLSFTIPNSMEERSRVAAKSHFDEAYSIDMSFDCTRFRQTAEYLFSFYTRRLVIAPHTSSLQNQPCVSHFEKMMQLVNNDITQRLDASQSDIPPATLERLKLTTIDDLYAPDNMNADEALSESVYNVQTQNRILVTGHEGLVSLDFCKQLAARLNIEHIDIYELLVKCYDDDNSSTEASATIRQCIEEEKPIPVELQATLVRQALEKESVKYGGYVFGELPPALEGDDNFIKIFLEHSGLCSSNNNHQVPPPRTILDMQCPSSNHANGGMYRAWRAKYRDDISAVYSAELDIRDQEWQAEEAKTKKVEAKEAARQRREEREANREKIANGELPQPSDEELELEAQQDAEDAALLEEEEEVDPDTLDENGMQVDPDEVPKIKEQKAAARKRRSDLAEIHRLYHASRTCDLSATQVSAYAENEDLRAVVEAAKSKSTTTGTSRYLRLACFDDATTLVDFACSHLQLTPTITPKVQTLPEDVLQGGYESSPDADAATAEQFQQELQQAGFRRSAFGDYCPVTKLEDGVLVQGTWFYSCSFREYCYCFCSSEKLNKFVSNPDKYLRQDYNSRVPIFLLQENFEVLESAGIDAAKLHQILGDRLKLSCRSLSQFVENWTQYDAEVARRKEIEAARKVSDQNEKKDREAKMKAAVTEAEQAAKKGGAGGGGRSSSKKSGGGASSVSKKGGKASAAQAAALAEQQKREKEIAEAREKANALSPMDQTELQERLARAQAALVESPQTTETRLQSRVTAEQQRADTIMRPLLVSALENWNGDDVNAFRARHVLPDVVVCFQNIKPPKLDADGNPIISEEEEEELDETQQQQQQLDDDENNNDQQGEGGAADTSKMATDPSADPRKSRAFWSRFLTDLEEESANAEQQQQQADDSQQQQAFRIVKINVHDVPLDVLVEMVLYSVREIGFKCDPADQTVGELTVEDDEDEMAAAEDEDNEDEDYTNLLASNPLIEPRAPILRPRARAVHQFGDTATYCPVALVRDGLLVHGDPTIWTQLNGKKFMFATQANMEAFKLLPRRYIPSAPPQPAPLPPPRVWLLGPSASGKDTLANQLINEFGLQRFSTKPEKLFAYLAAATNESLSEKERTIDGVLVPFQNSSSSSFLKEAIELKKELDEFAKDQREKQQRRAQAEKDVAEREQWIDDGEDVEDLTEAQQNAQQEALDWEAEDEETKIERLALAHRKLSAALSRIEPWASKGYILVGEPANDTELTGLLDAQMIPEAVVRLTLGVDAFLERRFKDELAVRQAEFEKKIRDHRMKQSALQLFARVAEITKWRRRNIGTDDIATYDPPELEDAENEPEPVDVDAIRGDLEQKFETSVSEVEALVEILPERRIPVVTLRGDDGHEALLATAKQELSRNLIYRDSILENPQVITIDEANTRLEKTGRSLFSAFGTQDPVLLYERRHGTQKEELLWDTTHKEALEGVVLEEPAYVEPEPETAEDTENKDSASKNKTRKTKIIEDEDGNEVEVTDDDEEDNNNQNNNNNEEEEDQEPPVDPFADLEEYPQDLSPEEIEEMQQELNAKRKKRADRLGRRACILRNRIYFFDNDVTLKKFLTLSCRRYAEQAPPLPNVLGNVVAVQTSSDILTRDTQGTIQSISRNANNAVFLSLPKLLEWGCNQSSFRRLRQEGIMIALNRSKSTLYGQPELADVDVPDGWIEEALAVRLMCADVQQRGCVLCNLPRTLSQLSNLLSERIDIIINTVLIFDTQSANSIEDPVANPATEYRHEVAKTLGQTIRAVHEMESPLGTSKALYEAQHILSSTFEARRSILVARKLGFPLVVDHAALPESFILDADRTRCPQYSYYCPWTWARENRLLERDPKSDLIQDPSCSPRKNIVEFLNKLYFFSDSRERIQEFLSYPERFIGEKFKPKALPQTLPHRLVNDQKNVTASSSTIALDSVKEDQLELCGFCPVVLCDTRNNRGLMGLVEPKAVHGKRCYIAEYNGRFYSMSSEENMQRFLSEPWTFVDGAVLPAADQFPPASSADQQDASSGGSGSGEDLQSVSLEMFLRRALRESVARAMCDVERIRPKFPSLSAQQSALRFIALHIRAHHPDPNQSEFAKRVHKENYEQFVELATMAREGGLVPPAEDAPQEVKDVFQKRCQLWDDLFNNPEAFFERFSGLRMEPEDEKLINKE